jgi:hypothetical protein
MRQPAAVAALVLAAGALAACGGGERQDAGAPSGAFAVDVTRASFPARQSLARHSTLRLVVRNTGDRDVPDLAVTVATAPARAGQAPSAFGTRIAGADLADATRPVWVLDRGPQGGDTAYVDTWAFGGLPGGATRTVAFRVTAARAGRWRLTWRVAPALEGDVRLTGGGRTRGAFDVTITDAPVDSRVGRGGVVVRAGGA